MNLITWPQAKISWLIEQGFSPTTITRFYQHIEVWGDCWIWKNPNAKKYGKLEVGTHQNKCSIHAHKLSWLIHFGPVPNGLQVLHRCDIMPCVNPAHLWVGSHKDNHKDKSVKWRSSFGERNTHSKLKSSQVREIRALAGQGLTQKEIGERYGISQSMVSLLILRKAWRHI